MIVCRFGRLLLGGDVELNYCAIGRSFEFSVSAHVDGVGLRRNSRMILANSKHTRKEDQTHNRKYWFHDFSSRLLYPHGRTYELAEVAENSSQWSAVSCRRGRHKMRPRPFRRAEPSFASLCAWCASLL